MTLTDAGGGPGTWQLELRPQAATTGAVLDLPPAVDLPPGGSVSFPVTATASAGAAAGASYGFVALRQGSVVRRLPYAFFVTRPRLPLAAAPIRLRSRQTGDTRRGASHARVYCCPSEPFGPPPDYVGRPMDEAGAEHVYVTRLSRPVVNAGVSVVSSTPGSQIDPWWLGSLDENDVQGYAGTPVNVNDLMPDAHLDVHAAGVVFAQPGEYFVSVDSGSDPQTGRKLPGRYVLRSWVDDTTPPTIRLLTTRVSAGRPLVVARVTDSKSGVDPGSLVLGYRGIRLGGAAYEDASGLALFRLVEGAPPLAAGRIAATVAASDLQETKNVSTLGPSVMPNTRTRRVAIAVVDGPTVTWIAPARGACVRGRVRLLAVGGSTAAVRGVRFLAGSHSIASSRATGGLYRAAWPAAARGRHELRVELVDARGRTAVATRVVRTGCR